MLCAVARQYSRYPISIISNNISTILSTKQQTVDKPTRLEQKNPSSLFPSKLVNYSIAKQELANYSNIGKQELSSPNH